MTAEMRAKTGRRRALGLTNVTVLEGFAEDLPVAAGVADVVISNGVINLCPDKRAIFREMYRVLKQGGRIRWATSWSTGGSPGGERRHRTLERLNCRCSAGSRVEANPGTHRLRGRRDVERDRRLLREQTRIRRGGVRYPRRDGLRAQGLSSRRRLFRDRDGQSFGCGVIRRYGLTVRWLALPPIDRCCDLL
ncbi:MAG: methyltransferase domain-containing protein [Dehalococcoidia bacterium]|nr:methyltransferase domain-containing protein [Dehalococcoidia bacterium]